MLCNIIVEVNKIISFFEFGVQRNEFLKLVESVTSRASAFVNLLPFYPELEFEKSVAIKAPIKVTTGILQGVIVPNLRQRIAVLSVAESLVSVLQLPRRN